VFPVSLSFESASFYERASIKQRDRIVAARAIPIAIAADRIRARASSGRVSEARVVADDLTGHVGIYPAR